MLRDADKLLETHLAQGLVALVITLLVTVSAKYGKVQQGTNGLRFRPSLGTRLVLWMCMGLWAMLILAPLDLGIYWLAYLFAIGPLCMVWRWPATIVIDETSIRAVAPLRSQVRMHWNEVESVDQSAEGDAVILRSRTGEKIKVPSTQIGAEQLFAEIEQHTGMKCDVHEVMA